MGYIKYKNEVLYSGPIGEVDFSSNWCDSMATYYPYVMVSYIKDGLLKMEKVDCHTEYESDLEIVLDKNDEQIRDFILSSRERERQIREEQRLDYHKLVKVVKGRKIPIGTEGEIFWMGNTKYGASIGLRLLDGSKVFTSPSNVRCITQDELFEREVLGNG